jgi:outer membrane protein TolC
VYGQTASCEPARAAGTAAADKQTLFGSRKKYQRRSLENAMARALKYNMDYRVKLMEEAMGQRQLDVANLDMLPKLAASAGYTARDKDNASSSQNIALANSPCSIYLKKTGPYGGFKSELERAGFWRELLHSTATG